VSLAVTIRGVGHWLVVGDRLDHAQAVVVLSGHLPFRAMEAASIYHKGWAQEIWLTKATQSAEEKALARMGIRIVRGDTINRQVLERLGVPPKAIRLLDEGVRNTAEEIQLVGRELQQAGGDRVIIVTSKSHSRRVGVIWGALLGDNPKVIVRYTPADPFDPGRWWRNTKDALAVSREVFGIINVWTGFPVQPERQG